jgi:putative spermidine/putrescine transport system ATP-binding protein
MRDGHVEQIGTADEIYNRPATPFVAGFVGVSNILSGEAARVATGSPETVTVRPEKIRMTGLDEPPPPGESSLTGHVREVVYLGANTRFVVELDAGGELVVVQQNLRQSSMEALQVRGRAVRLVWDRLHSRRVGEDGSGSHGPREEGA